RSTATRAAGPSCSAKTGSPSGAASARSPPSFTERSRARATRPSSTAAPRAQHDERIDGDVDRNDGACERKLDAAREPARIKHRQQEVLDESAVVTRLAAERAQAVLERRQRADPTAELYVGT